ncbi:hypothetical protein QVD17_15168 [Tagetes erecta]|uniref:Uncharacterized protein n=1 Tax=Tagetes erecta TaxID=13708 RepID=A0AAD8KNT3_TARER|nr:hypothetical protein QVD17_15168 [Tagetes erecta]
MNSSRWQDGGDDGNNKYKATEQRGGGAATLGLPVPAVSSFRFEVLKIQRLTLLCSDRTFKKEVNNEEEEENERGTIVVVPEMVSDFPVLGFICARSIYGKGRISFDGFSSPLLPDSRNPRQRWHDGGGYVMAGIF